MNSIREIIQLIKEKPGLYITQRSITSLKAYLDGWCHRDPETIVDIEILNNFQLWIQKRYRVTGTQSWANILLFYSVDEYEALELFFNKFDTYLSEIEGKD